ncbi:hypothetical protein O6H91_10G014100 [Diphasiastrum complanatum]|uniref:Uncharacterized protein n=2 Tax=Diphasiastrum complanatum TaxID=34168 RepID=A0ACC2CEL8_DIPCM|nr:hypothetical protein O6H91_10G013700 [Diphasiastrum complanatum]KAJ7540420.1 hypothetical protein O6H91_10G014100 [Diphasiastrum complanatum]
MVEQRLGMSPNPESGSRFLESVPFIVAGLIVAHLFAFVYWIYRVATDKPPERRKTH